MADKTTAQTTIDAVLRRVAPAEAPPGNTRNRPRTHRVPRAARRPAGVGAAKRYYPVNTPAPAGGHLDPG
ncbi:hypothetical protein, partial [Nocardia brasiliensis]|uniref:hypothetical protein n=1 Tax=Nocardia brasiliensis TaxID=37326 RepID=UPI002458A5D2